MNRILSQKTVVALWVVISFLALICISSSPLPAEKSRGNTHSTVSTAGTEDTGSMEKESVPPRLSKKKSILPWLIAGVGLVAISVAVYLLFIKKPKYDLTVNVGEGVSGLPATGKQTYKKGEKISYSFSLTGGGFKDLVVSLDDQPVAASGVVTMDRDHRLSAASTKVTVVTVNSTPTGVAIFDNGVDTGKKTNVVFEYSAAGSHTYLLRQCGFQDYVQTVMATPGIPATIDAPMAEGIYDEFDNGLSSCWKSPNVWGKWTVNGGMLKCNTPAFATQSAICYDFPFDKTSYTLTVKFLMVKGGSKERDSYVGIALVEGNNMRNAYGYCIYLCYGQRFYISKLNHSDIAVDWGHLSEVWFSGESRIYGYEGWNIAKIVRSGDNYSFYVNDIFLKTIKGQNLNPRYTVLISSGLYDTENWFDYVRQDFGAASAQAR